VASQRWRAAIEHYVGLDVMLKLTWICVVNQTGSIVQEGVVDSDPEAIASCVRLKAPGTVRIGIETGPTTTWLWTELNRLSLPVICPSSSTVFAHGRALRLPEAGGQRVIQSKREYRRRRRAYRAKLYHHGATLSHSIDRAAGCVE
jgi:hypothetical protein